MNTLERNKQHIYEKILMGTSLKLFCDCIALKMDNTYHCIISTTEKTLYIHTILN